MGKDVVVIYPGLPNEVIYPKIDRITEGAHALRLEAKKYKSLPYDTTYTHIVSIPYTAMRCWKEVDVNG